MKAIVVTPKEKDSITITDLKKPGTNSNTVLVKVKLVGLDGTDKEINEGLYGESPETEKVLVIGHESLGEVVEIGKNVKGFKIGDLVVGTVRRPEVKFKGMMMEAKPKRARTKGRYRGDDKSTRDVNEAWEGGKAPKKKSSGYKKGDLYKGKE